MLLVCIIVSGPLPNSYNNGSGVRIGPTLQVTGKKLVLCMLQCQCDLYKAFANHGPVVKIGSIPGVS